MGSQMETWIQKLSEIECMMDISVHIVNQAPRKVWSCNVKDVVLEPPVEFWNIDAQFSRAGKIHQPPCKFTSYHSQ